MLAEIEQRLTDLAQVFTDRAERTGKSLVLPTDVGEGEMRGKALMRRLRPEEACLIARDAEAPDNEARSVFWIELPRPRRMSYQAKGSLFLALGLLLFYGAASLLNTHPGMPQ